MIWTSTMRLSSSGTARLAVSGARRAAMARVGAQVRLYSQRPPHITIFSGTDCQLCDEAKEVLETVPMEFTVSTYNIRDDSLTNVRHWRRKYQYDIPVLHLRWDDAADTDDVGPEIARHRITREQIEAILAEGPKRI